MLISSQSASPMNKPFDEAYLFGYSPLFVDIASIGASLGIKLTVVCGKRQLSDVKALGLSDDIAILCLDRLCDSSFIELEIQQKKALGLSFGAPFIFKQIEIDMFKGNILNSHGAPLPQFKGGGGFSWRILQGDKRGSSLMHLVTTGIDEGPIAFRQDFAFGEEDRIPLHYMAKQLERDREHLLPWLTSVISGEASIGAYEPSSLPEAVDRTFQSYFPRLLTDFHAAIDWSWNAEQLQRFIRAFSRPHAGAYSFHRGRKIRILDCEIARNSFNHPFTNGLVTDMSDSFFEIAVSDGFLRVSRNEHTTDVKSLSLGDRFHTPLVHLESIKNSRVVYGPEGPRLISEPGAVP